MENLKCLFSNFPWDILLFCLFLGLMISWLLSRMLANYKNRVAGFEERNIFLEGELEACRKKGQRSGNTESGDIERLKSTILNLEAELDKCRKSKVASAAGINVRGAAQAKEFKKRDDLKVIEGIGPKIEKLCHKAGIYTFDNLANTAPEFLKEILTGAGQRYQMHDPATWPRQATLARDGKWDELKVLQDELNKGRD